jgi:hypothetical protein
VSAALGLKVLSLHQAAKFLVVHYHALMAQSRTHPPITVALEFVADHLDPGDDIAERDRNRGSVVEVLSSLALS